MPQSLTLRDVAHGPLRPVYALVSREALLVDDAVAQLRARVAGPQADFNSDEIDLAHGGIERLLGVAQTLPMMAERRWVRGRALHRLPAKEHAALMAYIKAPCPSTVLVLTAEKLDGRTKLVQALNRAGAVLTLEPPRPSQLPQWIRDRARSMTIDIEPEAATLLAELIGPELGILHRSLDMLALLAGPGIPVSADHVGEGIAASRVHSVFELTDALGRRDWVQASLLMRNILGGGESALLVLAMVVRQLRLLVQTQNWRGPARELAQELGVRPFVAEGLTQQATRFAPRDLYHALRLVALADLRLKSSRMATPLVLDGMLANMLVPATAAAAPEPAPVTITEHLR
jgi:DNA polymerase-3 subunit delta